MKMITIKQCIYFNYSSKDFLNGEYYGKDSKCVLSDIKNEKRFKIFKK